MLDTVYTVPAELTSVLMWLLLIWLNCFFFQIIEEWFRMPPSSEMHVPTDWGECVDFEEFNKL